MGIPRSLCKEALYSTSTKLQLPFSSVTEEYKVSRAGVLLTIRDSKDPKVATSGIELRSGRKWTAGNAVQSAETRLQHDEIVGLTCHGRQGIGCQPTKQWSKEDTRGKRELVLQKIRRTEEESRNQRMVTMSKQGAWMKWDAVTEKKISWSEIWKSTGYALKFRISSVYDLLPTPANLQLWGKKDDPACTLCGKRANLEHILSSCNIALQQGRYRWRHDQVLKELASSIDQARRSIKGRERPKLIAFVKAGSQATKNTNTKDVGLLTTANDWTLEVDLGKKLIFPREVTTTTLRPDAVLWSRRSKSVILIELTVPWEDRVHEAYERKLLKYQQLVQDCKEAGWKSWCFPVEVSARGFPGNSLWRMMSTLGVKGKPRKLSVKKMSEAAEHASSWLWLRSGEKRWSSTNA